ncbi:MAG: PhnD/SsuA/transferrin family substrate-binding protein [Negativicutes bacterium]|nr:PhnD/SsuA/transferrin family substrate-binding protein [Negativicutes bacterium]
MNQAKKILSVTLLIALVAALFGGCVQKPAEKIAIRIGALKGPTALGMLQLMQKAEAKTTANQYDFTLAGAPEEISAKMIAGELDLAAIPANLAAVLYNKTEGMVKMAAINTLGVLFLLENGDSVHSVEDLRGKTIYATGQASTPEYALNYILTSNGLIPGEDVQIVYKSEHAEVAALLAEGQIDLALLPQPFVTTVQQKSETVRIALDMTKEWEAVAPQGGSLVMGCLAVRTEFYQAHQKAVDAFLTEYKASVAYSNENVDAAAALSAQYNVIPEAVAKAAIPFCNIVYIDGDEMVTKADHCLQVLFAADAKSVGGKLPGRDLYIK